jgi:hypothetical protein
VNFDLEVIVRKKSTARRKVYFISYQGYIATDTHSWSIATKCHIHYLIPPCLLFIFKPSLRTEDISIRTPNGRVAILRNGADPYLRAGRDKFSVNCQTLLWRMSK